MKNQLFSALKVIPKNHLSFIIGELVHRPLPGVLGALSVKAFAKKYKINLDEAEKNISEYKTIGDLFTRKLKPGARPILGGVVHPADSAISQSGVAADGIMIQAKGKTYTVEKLLQSQELADKFREGFYITYYLCPTDYHRVHSPVTGVVRQSIYIPGELWPVNSWSVNNIRELFSVNERVVTIIETGKGPVAVVMVGATNVGKMTVSYDPQIVSNDLISPLRGGIGQKLKSLTNKSLRPIVRSKTYDGFPISAGDELGIFHMGSTVVLLYAKDFFDQDPGPLSGAVKMGTPLFP